MCDFYLWGFIVFLGLSAAVLIKSLTIYKNKYQQFLDQQKDVVQQSLLNQKEMISLLKEIRDLLRK
jgi:hypothetical protein